MARFTPLICDKGQFRESLKCVRSTTSFGSVGRMKNHIPKPVCLLCFSCCRGFLDLSVELVPSLLRSASIINRGIQFQDSIEDGAVFFTQKVISVPVRVYHRGTGMWPILEARVGFTFRKVGRFPKREFVFLKKFFEAEAPSTGSSCEGIGYRAQVSLRLTEHESKETSDRYSQSPLVNG